MTTVEVEEPDLVETKNVDSNGRIYVGKALAGEAFQVILVSRNGSDDGTTSQDKCP